MENSNVLFVDDEIEFLETLMKPVDINELLYKVQDACNMKRTQEEKIISIKKVLNKGG